MLSFGAFPFAGLAKTYNVDAQTPDSAGTMPDASPLKWHLGHTTWFFETFILKNHRQRLTGKPFTPFSTNFEFLFNSYYDTVGERHPRPQRGLLTRPSIAEVMAYREAIDEDMATAILIG